MKTRVLNYDETVEETRDLPVSENDNGSLSFEGFYYFSFDNIYYPLRFPNDIQQEPICFIAYKNNKIVGVLRLSHYVRDGGDFWAINYVDVHQSYRQQGIATALYQKLNEWCLNKNVIIVGTSLSYEGKKYKLNELRNKILVNCRAYENEDEYYQELMRVKV